jgi:hypothetical protein
MEGCSFVVMAAAASQLVQLPIFGGKSGEKFDVSPSY